MKNLNLPIIIIISLFLTYCSGNSDEDTFKQGQNLLSERKYDEAFVTFEELVKDYKESKFAPKALFECAKLYQGQVLKNLSARESLSRSVEVYKQIFEEYPQYEEAGNSLFMAGFILANDLKDFEKAKQTYNLYLEKYPNGQLADDARVELENLGKSPEEILKEKIQNENLDEKAI